MVVATWIYHTKHTYHHFFFQSNYMNLSTSFAAKPFCVGQNARGKREEASDAVVTK